MERGPTDMSEKLSERLFRSAIIMFLILMAAHSISVYLWHKSEEGRDAELRALATSARSTTILLAHSDRNQCAACHDEPEVDLKARLAEMRKAVHHKR